MPSPNTLALPIAPRDRRWTCHSSEKKCGKLYVFDKMHRTSIWVSDLLEGFRCFTQWLAEQTPVQKAGGSGDETRSLEASAQHLCRDFLNDCCGRGLLPGAPVPEYAAAVAAPVPPLRGNAAANAPLGSICKDFARGYCRRGNNCNLRHVAVPDGACRHFFLNGNCKYGNACKYRHRSNAKFDADAETQSSFDCTHGETCQWWHDKTEEAHVRDVSPKVCRQFRKRGYCIRGDSCKFLHM